MTNLLAKSFLFLCPFLLMTTMGVSQNKDNIKLRGNIRDSLTSQVLEYANVLATDTTGNDETIHFAMTDDKGFYQLQLKKKLPYKIEVTYLGYRKKTKIKTFSESGESLDFSLDVLDNELGEVIITSSIPPIIYKKDTIRYNAASFATGAERKLRELLQQMPGIEVDENNNVFVEGKRVTQLLVEGKPFFGGNSELAVKSLPADAVKTVEVLKEYNKVAFLSEVSGDNELAMNIELREDKKRFVFGEAKGGLGWEKRWDARSDLFYYSPKINVYNIAGHNNTNRGLLSTDQFIQLQGGMQKMMSKSGGFSFRNSSDIFNHISFAPNSIESRSAVLATGLDFSFSPHYQLNSYLILSDEVRKSRQFYKNEYFFGDDITLEEERDNYNKKKSEWWTSHVDFIYEKGNKNHLSLIMESNLSTINQNQNTTSVNVDTSHIHYTSDSRPQNAKLILDWSRKSENNRHIGTTEILTEWKGKQNPASWTDEHSPFLENAIPWVQDGFYTARQKEQSSSHVMQGSYKHYYMINKRNHISGKAAYAYANNHLSVNNYQLLSDGTSLSWENFLGQEKKRIQFNDLYTEFTFRHKKKKTEIELGTSIHKLIRKDTGSQPNHDDYLAALPFLKLKTNIPKFGEVDLEYRQTRNFPDVGDIYPSSRLNSFNSTSRGNPELGLESNHNLRLNLIKTNIFKHSNFFFRSYFSLQDKSIRNSIRNNGINQEYSYYFTKKAYYRLRTSLSYTKEMNDWKIRPTLRWLSSTSEKMINETILTSKRNQLQAGFRLSYRMRKKKQIKLSYQKSFVWFSQENVATLNAIDKLGTEMIMSMKKNWLLRGTYDFISLKGGGSSLNHSLHLSVEYHKENSPLHLELAAHNILNNKGATRRNTNETHISESTDFIFPFYTMLTATYEF